MMQGMRRPVAALVMLLGVALGVVSVAPLTWGFGVLLAVGLTVGGYRLWLGPLAVEERDAFGVVRGGVR